MITDTVARYRRIAAMSKSLAPRVAASGVAAIDTLVAKQTDKESTVAEVVAVAEEIGSIGTTSATAMAGSFRHPFTTTITGLMSPLAGQTRKGSAERYLRRRERIVHVDCQCWTRLTVAARIQAQEGKWVTRQRNHPIIVLRPPINLVHKTSLR